MAKVTLTYTLPEENNEFTIAKNGAKYYCALNDIDRIIRAYHKYDKPIKEVLSEISEILISCNLDEVE